MTPFKDFIKKIIESKEMSNNIKLEIYNKKIIISLKFIFYNNF